MPLGVSFLQHGSFTLKPEEVSGYFVISFTANVILGPVFILVFKALFKYNERKLQKTLHAKKLNVA